MNKHKRMAFIFGGAFKYSHSNNNFMAAFTSYTSHEVKQLNNVLVVIYKQNYFDWHTTKVVLIHM